MTPKPIDATTPCTVFNDPPTDFDPLFETAACYCLAEGRILLLKRAPEKMAPYTWGVPAGKLHDGESPEQAVVREIFEETGIHQPAVDHVQTVYVRYEDFDFTYYMYAVEFSVVPAIRLALDEHTEHAWVSFSKAMTMPLVPGGKECLKLVRDSWNTERFT